MLAAILLVNTVPVTAMAATTPSGVNDTTIAERINTLKELKGTYFTANGTYCLKAPGKSNHGCSNCRTTNIIASSSIRNTLGILPSSDSCLPSYYTYTGSMGPAADSCVGFAMIAHWYIYAQRSTDKVTTSKIASGTFNASTMSKAKKGDIIAFATSDGYHYHSGIFLGTVNGGVKILNSNFSRLSYGNCYVTEDTVYYSDGYISKVTISRATNYSASTVSVTGVSLNKTSATVTNGSTVSLSATVSPSNATNKGVTWSSSNTSVATVSSSGVVTAIAPGNATITATTKSGGYTATCYVTVDPRTYAVTYNANGGSGGPSSQTKTEDVALTLSSAVPTRLGYTFRGWATSSTATSAQYQPGAYFTSDGNATLYAVWEGNSNVVASGYCGGEGDGTNLEWILMKDGALTISGTGEMQNYSSSTECPWYTEKDIIKNVTIEKGVTNIGDWAFSGCTGLTEIVIPNSVTNIGGYAFCDCSSLIEIVIPDSVTSIGGGAFFDCTGLTEIVIPSNVTSIYGSAFSGCAGLTEIVIPSNVTSIYGSAFSDCTGLANIVISDRVTNIGDYAFSRCTGLTEIVIPDSVTSIDDHAFEDCLNLKSCYFKGDAPTAFSAADANRSFPADATLYYIEGKEGWSSPTWNGYKTEALTGTSYVVSYVANGGIGAPGPQTKTEGVALTLYNIYPTRSGYTFLGWSTSSNATSAEYQPGASYTADEDVTLYAVWEAASTYTVTFDANGGTGGPTSFEAEATVKVDGNYHSTIVIPATIPVKPGYTFVGWQAYKDGSFYAACSYNECLDIQGNTNFVAVWQKNGVPAPKISAAADTGAPGETVKVRFFIENNNGIKLNDFISLDWDEPYNGQLDFFSFIRSSDYSSTLSGDGKICELTVTISDDAKVGDYKFLISFGSARDAAGEACMFLDIPLTITVVNRSESKTYSVNYSANGGTGAPASQTKNEGVALTLSSTVPTRSGYNFLGWATSSTAAIAEYQPGASYTADENVTLYAVWEASSGYSITFDARGGTGGPLYARSNGNSFVVPSDVPTRDHWWFLYWIDDDGNKAYNPGDNCSISSDINLYACWAPAWTPIITIGNVSGAPGDIVIVPFTIENNYEPDSVTIKMTIDCEGAELIEYNRASSVSINGSIGKAFIRIPEDASMGQTYTISISIEDFIVEDSYHLGQIVQVNNGSILVSNEVPNSYTVTFDANGGTGAPASFKAEIMSGAGYFRYSIIRIPATIPVKTGYTFVGWQAHGSSTTACSPGENLNIRGDTNFVAVWQKNGVPAPKITAASVTGAPGETVKVEFYIENNNGIKFESFRTRGDSEWPGRRDYSRNYSSTLSGDGKIFETFYIINDDAKVGSYNFSISFSDAYNAAGEACIFLDIPFTITVVNRSESKTYTVNYSANGGSGAPAPQTKNEGVALTLSSTVPTRSGYTFLGWDTSGTATSAQYQPGASYTADGNVTLYAVWEKDEIITGPVIEVASVSGSAGQTVEVPILLKNNPGVSSTKLSIDYDETILEIVSATIGNDFKNISGANAVENITKKPAILNWMLFGDGEVSAENFAIITFRIRDGAPEGAIAEINVTYDPDNIFDSNSENVNFEIINGSVEVKNYLPGDINNDRKVNNKDVTRLFQYLSGLDVEVVEMALDVNGDEKKNNKDVTRLFQYLSGLDVEIY